ncbi:MAG: hypothetical protein LBS67_01810 [Clostridiales Family XIII bacterium]|nr:hypothetical protein [Clostridiales Family XIII bacterium]
MGDSSAGGYIREPSAAIREPLENAVHDMVAGLTGIAPALIRPAFQGEPLKTPSPEKDWCAFYIQDAAAMNYPAVVHSSDGDGHDEVTDWMDKEIRLYFYGPASEEHAGMMRRGLHIEQNRYALRQMGVAVRRVGGAAQMPELANGKWLRRCDLVIYITFAASASYAVLNLLHPDDGGQSWTSGNETWDEERYRAGTFLKINR